MTHCNTIAAQLLNLFRDMNSNRWPVHIIQAAPSALRPAGLSSLC